MTRHAEIAKLLVLLDSRSSEQEVQSHLESNPWMVAGITSLSPPLVIAKPPLGADFHPDFAFFWRHSAGSFIELVEIEGPSLEIFTGGDEFTSEFNHAVQQLADWEDWCNRHREGVPDLFEPLFDMGLTTEVPTYTRVRTRLVAGRRAQVDLAPRRKKRWQQKVSEVPGRSVRTWDGFIESLPNMLLDVDHDGHIRCIRYRQQTFEEVTSGREDG